MNIFIIDTNLVFSATISPDGNIAAFLRGKLPEGVRLFAPETMLLELDRHSSKLVKLTKKNIGEVRSDFETLLSNISIVSDIEIPFENYVSALRHVTGIDTDDISFVALNDHLGRYLVTGDRVLINGLINRGYSRVISFKKMMEMLD